MVEAIHWKRDGIHGFDDDDGLAVSNWIRVGWVHAWWWLSIELFRAMIVGYVWECVHYNINNKQKRDASCGVLFLSHFSISKFFCFFLARDFGFLFLSHTTFLYLFNNIILNHSCLADDKQASTLGACKVNGPTSLDHGSRLEGYLTKDKATQHTW